VWIGDVMVRALVLQTTRVSSVLNHYTLGSYVKC